MGGALLAGLVCEPKEPVSQQIAAWDESDILCKAVVSLKRQGAKILPAQLIMRVEELGRQAGGLLGRSADDGFDTVEDQRLMKLCRMMVHVGLTIDQEPGPALFENATRRIEQETIRILRKMDDRSSWDRLRLRRRKGFDGETIEEAARHVVQKLFLQVQEQFEGLDEAGQRRVAERIISEIEKLDAATQDEVRRRLGINQLSVDALRKTGVLAGLGTGLGTAVVMGGFGSYTLLTSTMASMAGVLGVTLPFKFYILATSTMAFLANPVTIVVAALGGGWLLRAKANRAIRDKYFVVLAALAVVARGTGAHEADTIDEFSDHARRRYREFREASGTKRKSYARVFPAFRQGPVR